MELVALFRSYNPVNLIVIIAYAFTLVFIVIPNRANYGLAFQTNPLWFHLLPLPAIGGELFEALK